MRQIQTDPRHSHGVHPGQYRIQAAGRSQSSIKIHKLSSTYLCIIFPDTVLSHHTVSSSDFYAYMKHTGPKDIVTYVRLVDDMKFVYIKDSYIHGANLSSYDPSEVSDIVNIFIDKVLSVKSVLECLRKIFSTYGIFIKC